MTITEIYSLKEELRRYAKEFDDCFRSCKSREHFRTYVEGQLGPLERKSVEPMADAADVSSRTLQEFLGLHRWNEDGARDRVQAIVRRDHSGTENIGIIDETSTPKKGVETACVQRQYCGATGKVDNCVVSVHLGFVSDDRFHTLLDADLYVPQSWHEDRSRCRKVGIPDHVVYRPMHEIALEQIRRARKNGVRLDWIAADERYGEVPAFLSELEGMSQLYVVEVPVSMTGWTACPPLWETREAAGPAGAGLHNFPRIADHARPARSVAHMAQHSYAIRQEEWTSYRVKDTEKGPEVWHVKAVPFFQKRDDLPSRPLRLLVAVNALDRTIKYFVSGAPATVPLETILRVAFSRCHIERCFEDSKGEIGFDHFEVRTWRSIRRHMAISLVSHLFLARQHARLRGKKSGPDDLPGQEGDRSAPRRPVALSEGPGPAPRQHLAPAPEDPAPHRARTPHALEAAAS